MSEVRKRQRTESAPPVAERESDKLLEQINKIHGPNVMRDADWLLCRDERWRPVEPGTFPLAHRAPSRVGRLRAYGNAIVARQAQEFIEVVDDAIVRQELLAA